jgi:hypothetical protein
MLREREAGRRGGRTACLAAQVPAEDRVDVRRVRHAVLGRRLRPEAPKGLLASEHRAKRGMAYRLPAYRVSMYRLRAAHRTPLRQAGAGRASRVFAQQRRAGQGVGRGVIGQNRANERL